MNCILSSRTYVNFAWQRYVGHKLLFEALVPPYPAITGPRGPALDTHPRRPPPGAPGFSWRGRKQISVLIGLNNFPVRPLAGPKSHPFQGGGSVLRSQHNSQNPPSGGWGQTGVKRINGWVPKKCQEMPRNRMLQIFSPTN